MKVLCAGLAKTGTKSLAEALRILGYEVEDVYDQYEKHWKEWEVILSKGYSTENIRKMFENVEATTDAPAYMIWEDIHRAFPESKVRFSVTLFILL